LDDSQIKGRKLALEAWKGGKIHNKYEGVWAKHFE
jgi:hypothetical protein